MRHIINKNLLRYYKIDENFVNTNHSTIKDLSSYSSEQLNLYFINILSGKVSSCINYVDQIFKALPTTQENFDKLLNFFKFEKKYLEKKGLSYGSYTLNYDTLLCWRDFYKKMYDCYPDRENEINKYLINEVFHNDYITHYSFTFSAHCGDYNHKQYINLYIFLSICPSLKESEVQLIENYITEYFSEIYQAARDIYATDFLDLYLQDVVLDSADKDKKINNLSQLLGRVKNEKLLIRFEKELMNLQISGGGEINKVYKL